MSHSELSGSVQLMACVRLLDGTDVVTRAECALWREELRGQEDKEWFDTLRRRLAKRFPVAHWVSGWFFLLLLVHVR